MILYSYLVSDSIPQLALWLERAQYTTMSQDRNRPVYRLFQRSTSVAGALLAICGFAMDNQVIGAMGIVILVQGLLGLGIIVFEDRRKTEEQKGS